MTSRPIRGAPGQCHAGRSGRRKTGRCADVSRRKGRDLFGVSLAAAIALGIVLHNMGEGLADRVCLRHRFCGARLVPGARLHSPQSVRRHRHCGTYGEAAPELLGVRRCGRPGRVACRSRSVDRQLCPLAHWAALAFAVGASAILQVIAEVGALLVRNAQREGLAWLSAPLCLVRSGCGCDVRYRAPRSGLMAKSEGGCLFSTSPSRARWL